MTTIHVGDGFKYTITEEDYLWLGRSLAGEGPNVAGYIWAYIQKFAGTRGVREQHRTLTNFIRSYSQPVNPIWARGGSRCPVPVEGTDCAENLLRRRAEKSALQPAQFPLNVKAALTALRAGVLPNPVGRATDFATCDRVDRDMREGRPRAAGWQITSRVGGCFVSTTLSRSWPDGWVTLGPSPGFWLPLLGGFAVATAALGGWIWWRSR